MATIQIPLKHLELIMDVKYMDFKDKIRSLLSMRDMYMKVVDKSIQKCHIRFGDKLQKLEMTK